MKHFTVEKIGGTSMSRFDTVLKHIMFADRKANELYKRVFVVSAYAGITNLLLEHKKNSEPGVFTYYINDDEHWRNALNKVKQKMLEINLGFESIGLDIKVANAFVEQRLEETQTCLEDLKRLRSYGHFSKQEFIPAIRELLTSIGEAHSAFNSANIMNNNGAKALFVDLTGWLDEEKLPVMELIEKNFRNINIEKELPFVTGYVKCQEGFVTKYERGYSEVTLSKLASFLKAKEVVVHKEYDLCSADPELLGIDRVKIVPEINYDMADQLADLGMEAIHPKAAKEMMKNGVTIRVKNIFQKNHPGTLIHNNACKGKTPAVELICGNTNVTAIELWDTDMIGQAGYDHRLVSCLEKYNISYISKLASANTITHFVYSSSKNLDKCIDEIKNTFSSAKLDINELSVISLVGNLDTEGVLARGATAIANKGIKILTTIAPLRQINVQFVVARTDYKLALSELHKALIE